ncbi:PREDICTED: probable polygalacturonase At1g80170 [Tarenaya hassleriana]|uniref:probable polygalacturonase At1g80170 n=1 Tax=Tarenaya hassleriana TaxID=28532 RepID=UPI0008FD0C8E|nr:PREDICTED: probable polygalacturonase At1g80170 [Tarenaya hassleriana]
MRSFLFVIFFLIGLQNFLFVQSRSVRKNSFNVLHHGAVGDGIHDDTKAFMDAWEHTCNYMGSKSTMEIPRGKTFLLQPIEFNGPCKSKKIFFRIDGDLTAPKLPHKWRCENHKCDKWIGFGHLNGLYIDGRGTLDGQGRKWWSLNCKHDKIACQRRPRGIIIAHSNNVHVSNVNVKDSPNFQMSFESSRWVYVKDITITADGDSPNTDGIHLQRSQNVFISDSVIQTGDDCISIGDGSKHVNISKISCGPGHGISIGSLGRNGNKEAVESVYVRDSTFRSTTNGVRIKTWQGGKGHVRNVVFEHITFHESSRPIIIDQYYCPHSHCKNHTSAVRISDITYRHIHGTSDEKASVQLLCSETVPCRNIYMSDINLYTTRKENDRSSRDDHGSLSECINARGLSNGIVRPRVPCLRAERH